MTRVLITGGSGYFGCTLRDRLLADGHQVRIFDLVDTDDRPDSAEIVLGDIRDPVAVRSACADVDIVHHNVAQVPLAKDRRLFWSVNCGGTETLLREAKAAGVRKIVHTSSSAVYGVPAKNPVDESVAPHPREAYGRAKLAAEQAIFEAVNGQGLDVTIVRPRTILGHGRLGIFQILFDWVAEGRRIPVLGKGDNLYQFVYADDLADACVRAGNRPGASTYNIGAAEFGTMRSTLETLCSHAATGSTVYSIPMGPAVAAMKITSRLGLSPLGAYHSLMYGRSMYFDITKAREELDWQPTRSNSQMICESYDWYIEHKRELMERGGESPHRSPVRQGILALLKRMS